MKGADLTANDMHNLTSKAPVYIDEDDPDKMGGLGHDKKEHMNSGIYAGVES